MQLRTYRVTLQTPEGKACLEVREDEFILDAAYMAGLDIPSMCLQGFCLTCASRLLRGNVDQSSAVRFYPEDKRDGFILICSAKPLSDLCIKTHQKTHMQQHRKKQGLPYPQG